MASVKLSLLIWTCVILTSSCTTSHDGSCGLLKATENFRFVGRPQFYSSPCPDKIALQATNVPPRQITLQETTHQPFPNAEKTTTDQLLKTAIRTTVQATLQETTDQPPQTVDTIGSCPEGYSKFRGICYKAFIKTTTFTEATAACRVDGGTLAMSRDAETNAFLTSLYWSAPIISPFWFGLHDQREEGRFEWVDGTPLGKYSSWFPGQPSDPDHDEDCVHFTNNPKWKDKWADSPCQLPKAFLCQVVPGRG